MKNGKSPGLDSLSAELYKEGGDELLREITLHFNQVYSSGAVPEEWGRATICPIFKGGDVKEDKK